MRILFYFAKPTDLQFRTGPPILSGRPCDEVDAFGGSFRENGRLLSAQGEEVQWSSGLRRGGCGWRGVASRRSCGERWLGWGEHGDKARQPGSGLRRMVGQCAQRADSGWWAVWSWSGRYALGAVRSNTGACTAWLLTPVDGGWEKMSGKRA
jgi:hypothetical protein